MRWDWVPVSAALLVTGAMAFALASLVTEATDSAGELLRSVEADDGRWLTAAVVYLFASACLTLGLPAVLLVVEARSRVLGGAGVALLAFGFIGLAGYGMLITFFRALVITGGAGGGALEAATEESGLTAVIYGWIIAFVLGELLVTIALFRSPSVPTWIPVVLAAHLVVVCLDAVVPDSVTRVASLLLALGLSGVGLTAAAPARARAV